MIMNNESENLDLSDVSKTRNSKRNQRSFNSNESSDLSDDVFYTYSSNNQIESVSTVEVKPRPKDFQKKALSAEAQVVSSCRQRRHKNLYKKTLPQLFRLARARYWNIPNLIRLLIILGSISIFVYNVQNILKQYFEYKTLIMIEYQKPNWTTLPAVSFCTHCVLCAYDKKWFKFEPIEYLLQDDQMWRFTTNYSTVDKHLQNMNDATIECWVRHNGKKESFITCDKIAPVIESFMYGHKCWSFFADFYGDMRRKKKTHPELTNLYYENFPEIFFSVKGYFLSLAQTKDLTRNESTDSILGGDGKGFWTSFPNHGKYFTGIYFAIHNPDSLGENTYIAFQRLNMGNNGFITFTRRVQQLLPEPYDPHCFPYRSDEVSPAELDIATLTAKKEKLTSSGLHPYRSRTECYLHCMHRLLNTNRCGNFYSSYTDQLINRESLHRMQEDVKANTSKYINATLFWIRSQYWEKSLMRFCEKSNKDEFMKAKEICLDTCPANCYVENFIEDDFIETLGTEGHSRLTIKWASKHVVSLKHKPKVIGNQSELLSMIGGSVFFFLEVSLLYLFIFLIHFFESVNILSTRSCLNIYSKWRQRFLKPPNTEES